MKNKKQFTLIELIIVIVVIGILAAMALPKFNGVVRDAKTSSMINDKEVLEKAMILYYQKYDKLPLLNDDQDLITLSNSISLVKIVQAEEIVNDDTKTIYTSLQETLKYYNDSEENLYRIDIKEINNNLSKKLKYGTKKEDKDFYVYSTKTNNVYYYNIMLNGEGEIHHNEYNTKLKISELVDKKSSYYLNKNETTFNNKPIVKLITVLDNLNENSIINWEYNFTDEDKEPTKISFILNDVEYNDFSKIPTKLEEGNYTIKLKMQDSKGLWSDEITNSFFVDDYIIKENKTFDLGDWHSLYIDNDGKLYSWGKNSVGQLGIGNTINQSTPQLVMFPNEIKAESVFTGESHSMAIGSDGNLYAWGYNNCGQLGIGNSTNQNTPQLVKFPNDVKPISISLGGEHSMALCDDGNLYAWGYNGYGQLGIGNTINQSTPQLVTLPDGIKLKEIFARRNRSSIMTTNEKVYSWGYNSYGELGLGNTKGQNTPQLVTLPNGVKPKYITLGYENSMIIGDDKNYYLCGYNYRGSLGNSSTSSYTYESIYKKGTLPNGVKLISASLGYIYTICIGDDGNVYTWGNNEYGQLGIGNFQNKDTPQKITLPDGETPTSVIAGGSYCMIISESGNVYGIGENRYGQLGIGNLTNQWLPIKIPNLYKK